MNRLSGWWRGWVVISVLWTLFAIAAAWPSRENRAFDMFPAGQASERVADLIRNAPDSCVPSSIETTTAAIDDPNAGAAGSGTPYLQASLSCRPKGGVWLLVLFVIIPPLILAALGLAIKWVAQGFRRGGAMPADEGS